MKRLYLFNPDTDLASANNNENYMPPQSSRRLGEDLAMLPIWYGEAGSSVLAKSHPNLCFLQEMQTLFDLPFSLVTYSELGTVSGLELMPWGWNTALHKNMLNLGLVEESLISNKRIQELRDLSHRQTSVDLLSRLPKVSPFCGESYIVSTVAELEGLGLSSFLLKAPLSGSGKGLKWCSSGLNDPAINWFERVVQQQGSVVIEPIYEKAQDLAFEFFIHSDTEIEWLGYSLFSTTTSGAYTGNVLDSDSRIQEFIENKYGLKGVLQETVNLLSKELLLQLGSSYRGPLGVDAIVCSLSGGADYRLHPCIEVNLRMNMGIVSHRLFNRYVNLEKSGSFRVDYHKKQGFALDKHKELSQTYPLIVKDGRVDSGYLSLAPVTNTTQYHCWILIE